MASIINEEELKIFLRETVRDLADEMLSNELSGHTWGIDEFRKACCGGKDKPWVSTFIFAPFKKEIDVKNGGWLIPAHGKGTKFVIFAKPACEWMEENRQRIDWEARILK
ncbi:DUF771 domain-containing protein [Liquorilactobacillus satsumensis]|uniref:DUF771 domain-containing protein n=1 Tax=Liquorilactobacillus satsumensis DSM 16230 = JCM 12392 TaxID=1423801 RepID=A0A0R1V283_9LACO|nr:DUF771 domain-containing protein [Liquorilactobacillus satsumensis]KRL99761.1 hypothetical protein FD50_GL000081 [Liquorilactobacillus satsumensis DSM 16230 = JCM 12392]